MVNWSHMHGVSTMKDGHSPSDRDDAAVEDVTSTAQSVPQEAEWELVVQRPVENLKHGGLTATIISAVADAEGVQPVEIKNPPLFGVLDTADSA